MLKQMRTGAQSAVIKFVLFGILMLATFGLVLMDYQGMFRGGYKASTVASVDGDKISAVEFETMLQGALRRQQMSREDAWRTGYPAQYLQNEINQRILVAAVNDLGLVVSDQAAAKQIKEALAPIVKMGVSEQQALQNVLMSYGINERTFVQTQKADIGLNLLMRALTAGIEAPAQMAEDALKFHGESRRGEYFAIAAADAGKVAKPSEDDLKKHYGEIARRYMLPEYRKLAVVALDAKALLGATGEITEEQMKAWYEENKDSLAVPETRSVSQLVAQDEAAANTLFAEAVKSKDLKAVAEGPGKGKAAFVPAASFTESDVPVDIADAFKADEGAVMAPVQTPLGWIVAKVEKVSPAGFRSYEDSKEDIRAAIAAEADNNAAEALYKRQNEIEDMIAGGKTLAEVAQAFGASETVIEKIDATGAQPGGKKFDAAGIPAFDKVLEAAFALKPNTPSQVIEAPTGEFVLAEAREIYPAEEQAFGTVRADVEKSWRAAQEGKLLDRKAAEILDKLKLGEDFEKTAAGLGKKITRTEMIRRSDHKKAAEMEKGMFPALFSLDKTGQVTAVSGEDKTYILRLAGRETGKAAAPDKEEIEALRNQLDHSVQKDILEQFRMSLMDKYNVKIYDEVLKEIYKPEGGEEAVN